MKHQNLDIASQEQTLTALTDNATGLGKQTVEITAFLTQLDAECHRQAAHLGDMTAQSDLLDQSTRHMIDAVGRMTTAADSALDHVQASTAFIAEGGQASRSLAEWVNGIDAEGETVREMLQAIQMSNTLISDIASQVMILAVNAKIEAARAGQAGMGFAIVAESVNELSRKTSDAAETISGTVARLAEWLNALQSGAARNAQDAARILDRSTQTDQALTGIETQVETLSRDSHEINDDANAALGAVEWLVPAIEGMGGFINSAMQGVEEASRRCTTLVDVSEEIMQNTVALGGDGADTTMIARVQVLAGSISQAFEKAITSGLLSERALFDTVYRPIPGTDPEQVTTAFTDLTDRLLPPLQEPVLKEDPAIIFCAAVDRNGYLPTHNPKFSQPQSDDPIWNAANCRNRRIFDDRVGLKAGRNERPFLLQVYRRDMGGGQFVMMKDLSAPIWVNGKHWGGLRLAYRF